MSGTAIILGAGASYGATTPPGALPLQAGLLARITAAQGLSLITEAREHAVGYLQRMYPGPNVPTPFEEIVGSLEWLESRQSNSHIGKQGARNVRTLLAFDTLLAYVLGNPMLDGKRLPVVKDMSPGIAKPRYDQFYSVRPDSPNAYSRLVDAVLGVEEPVGFLSFNYDLLLDRVLLHESCKAAPDYGISVTMSEYLTTRESAIALIKPHGSINWGWCTRCNTLRVFGTKMIFSGSPCGTCESPNPDGTPISRWPDGSMRTLLLRPSFVKDRRVAEHYWNELLLAGARVLARSPTWIFVGYSFPSADTWVRGWFREAKSLAGTQTPRRVIVVDPQGGQDLFNRYQAFFGKRVELRREPFADFASSAKSLLGTS